MKYLFALVLLLVGGSAVAGMSNAETIAALGGKVIGAANVCGANSNEVSRLTEKVINTASSRAKTSAEKGRVFTLFMDSVNIGGIQVSSGRIKCSEASSAFYDLGKQF